MTFLLIEHLSNLVCSLCVLAAAQGMTLEPDVGYATWPEGSVVRIDCSHEHPVEWIVPQRDLYNIPESEGGYLQITDASKRNTGLYTCQSAEGPHTEKSLYVKVLYSDFTVWRSPKAPSLITPEQKQIDLNVRVMGLLPSVQPNITWWYLTRPDRKPTLIRPDHRFIMSMNSDEELATLTIMNPSADDAGTYRVVASDEYDPYEETFLDWSVLAAGKTTVQLLSVDTVISHKGDLLRRYLSFEWHMFQCTVHSIPSPNITFEFVPCLTPEDCIKNQPVTPTFKFDPYSTSEDCIKNHPEALDRVLDSRSYLFLPNTTYCTIWLNITQPGKLSCSASSTSPKHYKIDHMYISVTEVKGDIVVQNPQKYYEILDLNEFELKCGASKRLYSEPTWKFRVNHSRFRLIDNEKGVTVKNNSTDLTFWSTLVIEPPFLVNRTGYNEYMCVTSDKEGRKRAEITPVHVEASQHPTINKNVQRYLNVTRGSRFELLVCDAGGLPLPSIRWYKVGSDKVSYRIDEGEHADPDLYKFREGREFLNFTDATEKIEGEYICEASNKKGNDTLTYTVRLIYSDVEATIDKNVQRCINVTRGSRFELLACDAGGFPSPSIRWYKVGSDMVRYRIDEGEHADPNLYIFRERRKFLIFTNATEKIEGEYICEASNKKGNDTLNYTVRLISVEKPREVPVSRPPEVPVSRPPDEPDVNDLSRATFLIGMFVCLAVIVAGIFVIIYTKRKNRSKNLFLSSVVSQNQPLQGEQPSPHISVPGDWSEALQLNPRWEFPVEMLKLGDELGRGAFGVVKIAEAIGIKANEDRTIVAVKQPKHKTEEAVTALAKELKIMDHVGAHMNIANLLGACTKHLAQRKLYVIVEYCKYGSLDNFLRSHHDNFIDEVNQVTGNLELHSSGSMAFSVGFSRLNSCYIGGSSSGYCTGETVRSSTTPHTGRATFSNTPLGEDDYLAPRILLPPSAKSDLAEAALKTMSTTDLLCWGYQIANGMDYLGDRKIVHCDLATRNILLAEGNVVKLCDFGLAKDLGIYLVRNPDRPLARKGNERLPIKWLSIEAIEHRAFSIQSDVWAYGVVLWEMFTLGSTPYPCINARDLLGYLKNGNRMKQPEHATRAVYNLMKECWDKTPKLRPSFKECAERLGSSLGEGVKQYYLQLNDDYLDLNKDLDKDREYLGAWLEPTYENVMARGPVNEVEINTGDPTVYREENNQNGAEEDAIELKNLPPQPDS